MATNNTHKIHDDVEDTIKDATKELPDSFVKHAENARQAIVARLREAAEKLRGELKNNEDLDERARTEATKVVTRLDKVGDYLEEHDVNEIESEVREFAQETVRENTWQVILVALIIGFLLGLILKRGDD